VRIAHRMRYTRCLTDLPEEVDLHAIRLPSLAAATLALLLQACATTPPEGEAAADPQAVPELTLNLPQGEDCICVPESQADYTFLEKGFTALLDGDHVEAVQYFQRYQRLESSPQADWEAGITIAYDSMLPQSPFYDPQAARKSYTRLKSQQVKGAPVHEKVLIMRDSLEIFMTMRAQIYRLNTDNAVLKEEVAKREEALKRLRELALGQKGVKP
jgi:hypothetical protein